MIRKKEIILIVAIVLIFFSCIILLSSCEKEGQVTSTQNKIIASDVEGEWISPDGVHCCICGITEAKVI